MGSKAFVGRQHWETIPSSISQILLIVHACKIRVLLEWFTSNVVWMIYIKWQHWETIPTHFSKLDLQHWTSEYPSNIFPTFKRATQRLLWTGGWRFPRDIAIYISLNPRINYLFLNHISPCGEICSNMPWFVIYLYNKARPRYFLVIFEFSGQTKFGVHVSPIT